MELVYKRLCSSSPDIFFDAKVAMRLLKENLTFLMLYLNSAGVLKSGKVIGSGTRECYGKDLRKSVPEGDAIMKLWSQVS